MTDKQIYTSWSVKQKGLPVFMQPWWMDAACLHKQWQVLLIYTEGQLQAAMPYLLRKRMGMKFVLMPQQTQIGGAWTTPGTDAERIASEIDKHLKQLRICYYYQQYPLHSPVPLFMRNLGYRVEERVTYRIEDCSDVENVIRQYNRNKQRQLKKSLSYIAKRDSISAKELYRFHKQALEQQGKVISYSQELLQSLVDSAVAHRQGTVVALYEPANEQPAQTLAAAFYVWDTDSVHYMIAVQHPDKTDCGLMTRLVTEGIRLANELQLAFDFEGSMIPGVANHFRQFGAAPATYYSVEKFFNPLFVIAWKIYQLLTRKKR